jgi:hypothetical protein
MCDAHQLRNRATRLLAMAYKAGKEGHLDCAERFTQRASEILDQPTALERLGTQGGERVTEHPEPRTTAMCIASSSMFFGTFSSSMTSKYSSCFRTSYGYRSVIPIRPLPRAEDDYRDVNVSSLVILGCP